MKAMCLSLSMQGIFARGEILEILKFFIESDHYLERNSTPLYLNTQ